MKAYDLCLLSVLIAILFVSEQLLTFIPNVQITFLLIILYSNLLKFKKTFLIIVVHVILDNLFNSGSLYMVPTMILSYSVIPLVLTIFKITNEVKLAFISIIFVLIYTSSFIIPTTILFDIKIIDYLKADILFTIILIASTFLSVLWLYKPLYKFLEKRINLKGV